MNTFEHMPRHNLKIEEIETMGGNGFSCSPERGGIVTSIKFKGKEVLYLDESTFYNVEDNVRGGIPVLFPNAGPIEGPKFPNLKQHGFARNEKWEFNKIENGIIQILKSNVHTKEIFPYDFYLRERSEFQKDGSFNINQSLKNLEKGKELPLSMGLHPYFKVLREDKKDIKFNFKGGNIVEEQIEKWANGKAVSIDNPNMPMEIIIPKIGTLILKASKEYQKIWFWSQPEKDFICAEPVMRDKGGITNDPQMIKGGDIYSLDFNINLKE